MKKKSLQLLYLLLGIIKIIGNWKIALERNGRAQMRACLFTVTCRLKLNDEGIISRLDIHITGLKLHILEDIKLLTPLFFFVFFVFGGFLFCTFI